MMIYFTSLSWSDHLKKNLLQWSVMNVEVYYKEQWIIELSNVWVIRLEMIVELIFFYAIFPSKISFRADVE